MGKAIRWVMFYTLILCSGCSERGELGKKEKKPVVLTDYSGSYVSDGYEHRAKGFDYLSVHIVALNDSVAEVSVRSRTDNKEPTCSFDSKAFFIAASGSLEGVFDGKRILFNLDDDTLSISVPDNDDHMMLYFLSPGGSSLMGDYYRTNEDLSDI